MNKKTDHSKPIAPHYINVWIGSAWLLILLHATAADLHVLLEPPPGRIVHGMGQWEESNTPGINTTSPHDPSGSVRRPLAMNRPEPARTRLPDQTTAPSRNAPADKMAELTKWDKPEQYLPSKGPGGTVWDAQYRSFIQSDESATSKGFPTHAEATNQIKADAAKNPANLQKHKGWILFIKHHSRSYRPESATDDLRKLYEALLAIEFGGAAASAKLPFEDNPRLAIYRDVIYGKSHPTWQQLDAYLIKSDQPTPVLIEIHGGGWRRGVKSQFIYPGDLMGRILEAGISVVSINYRLTPEHPFPAQMQDVARAIQFVRSQAKAWNLDPQRIIAMGGSAGAHLSAWIALHDDLAQPESVDPIERQSTRLSGFIALSGPMDLTRVRPIELARQPLRGQDFANAFTAAFACTPEQYEQDEEIRKRIRDASPVFLVSSDDPPALIMGAAREAMRVEQHPPVPEVVNDPHSAWHGVLLADMMAATGLSVVTRLDPTVGRDVQADTDAILQFLRQQLRVKINTNTR
jgi:acetyl esterase/lipase